MWARGGGRGWGVRSPALRRRPRLRSSRAARRRWRRRRARSAAARRRRRRAPPAPESGGTTRPSCATRSSTSDKAEHRMLETKSRTSAQIPARGTHDSMHEMENETEAVCGS
eukprot:5711662-Pleurochrysis_carterae.AAC.5